MSQNGEDRPMRTQVVAGEEPETESEDSGSDYEGDIGFEAGPYGAQVYLTDGKGNVTHQRDFPRAPGQEVGGTNGDALLFMMQLMRDSSDDTPLPEKKEEK